MIFPIFGQYLSTIVYEWKNDRWNCSIRTPSRTPTYFLSCQLRHDDLMLQRQRPQWLPEIWKIQFLHISTMESIIDKWRTSDNLAKYDKYHWYHWSPAKIALGAMYDSNGSATSISVVCGFARQTLANNCPSGKISCRFGRFICISPAMRFWTSQAESDPAALKRSFSSPAKLEQISTTVSFSEATVSCRRRSPPGW